ncbi:MAG: hypothetical protein C4520_14830 [Candidatus Abyssobacteria bacterium SURF_5]|uniref:Uncharacterized protein n=1 Tax=Abyssobacteria bacterium (strain SURF_5) TaxID=2093360 RepID=A0A3A4NFQ1_ABYX5|nr:MAG: hypothetical protein C4520_14830 [Candidatus Abyssubacteria bacterium SURF_5]
MAKETKADEKALRPIKLDTDQLKELDRLIDSLKKEIVFPAKKSSKSGSDEAKTLGGAASSKFFLGRPKL